MKLISVLILACVTAVAAGPAMAKKGGYPKGKGWQAVAGDFQELGAQVEEVGANVLMAKDQLADIQAVLAQPLDVNIINQPVEVTGNVSATLDEPVAVEGSVDASVSGTVQVENTPGGSLNVVIDPQSQEGISHQNQPIANHIQLQATAVPIATAGIMSATRITPMGGGQSFDLPDGQCLVLTETEIAYINADTSVFPTVTFRMGLTDPAHTSVIGRRFLTDVADAGGAGVINVTFPSGIVMKLSDFAPGNTQLGLETFSARVVNFAATGYVIACD